MKDIFVICNQHGQFLGKQSQWLDESEPSAVWRSPHRDVALNHMIEANARDIEQRLVLLQNQMQIFFPNVYNPCDSRITSMPCRVCGAVLKKKVCV